MVGKAAGAGPPIRAGHPGADRWPEGRRGPRAETSRGPPSAGTAATSAGRAVGGAPRARSRRACRVRRPPTADDRPGTRRGPEGGPGASRLASGTRGESCRSRNSACHPGGTGLPDPATGRLRHCPPSGNAGCVPRRNRADRAADALAGAPIPAPSNPRGRRDRAGSPSLRKREAGRRGLPAPTPGAACDRATASAPSPPGAARRTSGTAASAASPWARASRPRAPARSAWTPRAGRRR